MSFFCCSAPAVDTGDRTKLYINAICPFAHRATFAAALLKQEYEIVHVPLSGQISAGNKLGKEGVTAGGEPFKDMSVAQMAEMKEWYKKSLNESGEVPTLVTESGDIIQDAEICVEFMDRSVGGGLTTEDPIQAARAQLAMKRFSEVIPAMYMLLKNQDPALDEERATALTNKLAAFEKTIDKDGQFCFGNKVTMTDVLCGPFLWRMRALLNHYRNFELFSRLDGNRLEKLHNKICAEPAFQKLTPIAIEQIVKAYEDYASDGKWADSPTPEKKYAGRGVSEFGK